MLRIRYVVLLMALTLGAAGWVAYFYVFTPYQRDCALEKDGRPSFTHTDFPRHIPFVQKNGFINDASCLNQTPIYGVVQVRSIQNVRDALAFAQQNNLPVSIAGARHSMGGHAFCDNALVLDMSHFNAVTLNYQERTINACSGATWKEIQEMLHPYGLSVHAMQSSNIFSVGGSISVNAHGMDHRIGSVGKTIQSLRIMRADGTIEILSPSHHAPLFNLVIGGYGLFGVILDAEIAITDNELYQETKYTIDLEKIPDLIRQVQNDPSIKLFYIHLSTSPLTFLRKGLVFRYSPYHDHSIDIPPLPSSNMVAFKRFLLNISKYSYIGTTAKWLLEQYFNECQVIIPQSKACLISRNAVMYDSVEYLRSNMRGQTDILQEYFVPLEQLVPFVTQMRLILQAHQANLLNCSLRLVHEERNFLTYATQPMVAVVLYINQKRTSAASKRMADLTSDLINCALGHQGTFFLPYQLYFTHDQLERAYPQWPAFVAFKKQYDPEQRFTQAMYQYYR